MKEQRVLCKVVIISSLPGSVLCPPGTCLSFFPIFRRIGLRISVTSLSFSLLGSFFFSFSLLLAEGSVRSQLYLGQPLSKEIGPSLSGFRGSDPNGTQLTLSLFLIPPPFLRWMQRVAEVADYAPQGFLKFSLKEGSLWLTLLMTTIFGSTVWSISQVVSDSSSEMLGSIFQKILIS